mgnify:CR=1
MFICHWVGVLGYIKELRKRAYLDLTLHRTPRPELINLLGVHKPPEGGSSGVPIQRS